MTDSPNPRRKSEQSINVRPLSIVKSTPSKVGRPPKLEPPDMPEMPMTEGERALFDFWIAAFKQQYPDLVPTDHLLLFLAGLEFIKYLRIIAMELEEHTVISMARQHPGVNMRALLDQLSVTRKARNQGKTSDDDEAKRAREELGKLFGNAD